MRIGAGPGWELCRWGEVANSGQTVQVEPTEFPDRLRGGYGRTSGVWELAELHQEGGGVPVQPGVRGDSVPLRERQRADDTHSAWWTHRAARLLCTLTMDVASASGPCAHPREKEEERGTP